jgi:hypothetical protein
MVPQPAPIVATPTPAPANLPTVVDTKRYNQAIHPTPTGVLPASSAVGDCRTARDFGEAFTTFMRSRNGRLVAASMLALVLGSGATLLISRGVARDDGQVAQSLPNAATPVPAPSPSAPQNAPDPALMSQASPQPPTKRLISPTPGDRQPTPPVHETRVNKAPNRAVATEKAPRGTETPPPAGTAHGKIEAKDSPETVQIPSAVTEHAWEDKLRWAHEVIANKNYAGARVIAQSLLDTPDLPTPIAAEARALIEESRNLESVSQRPRATFRIERVELLSELVQRGSRIIAVVHVTVAPPLEHPLIVTIRAQILKDNISISSPIQQDVTFPASSPSLRLRIPIEISSKLPAGDYYIQAGLWNTANAIQSLGRIRFKIP